MKRLALLGAVLTTAVLLPLANATNETYFNKFYDNCLTGVAESAELKSVVTKYPDFAAQSCRCGTDKLKTRYTDADVVFLLSINGKGSNITADEKTRKDTLDNMSYEAGSECASDYAKTHPM